VTSFEVVEHTMRRMISETRVRRQPIDAISQGRTDDCHRRIIIHLTVS
jgi:hypothetical protein